MSGRTRKQERQDVLKTIPPGGYVASPNPIKKPRQASGSKLFNARYSGKRGKDAVARVDARWHAEGRPKAGAEPWRKLGKGAGGTELLSIDAAYDLLKSPEGRAAYYADAARRHAPDPARTAHVDRPKPATADVASRVQSERRAASRKPKPTVQMKPISNDEAAQHLGSGTYSPSKQKSLRWLSALKALSTGYNKVSGGGALKAANRKASLKLLGPSGRAAGKAGGHYRKRGLSGKKFFGPDGRPGPRTDAAKFDKRKSMKGPTMTTKVDFNDLFKSELAADHLVDCPHCEAPITKSDLEKAHKGKGAVTHQSGPKHGKSSAHVRDHNPEGGAMRGGDGRGVHTSSRGVPGAKKHDEPTGVQNSKGSRARKGGNDDASSDAGSDDVGKSADAAPVVAAAPAGAEVKKSTVTVRGTDWVQYVDDGSDAALAKSITEGLLGGTSPTRPLDLNNDLSRLLI